MSFSGNLQGIGLADVFQNIGGNRTSGTLLVHWRGGERFVRFEDGAVSGFSFGVGKGLPLLAHVRQRRYVEEKRLDSMLKRNRRSRKSAGKLLVEGKLLSEDELCGVITELIQESAYDLVLVSEATFEFTEGDPPARVFDIDQRDAQVRLDAGPLLIEGARRADEWDRIRKVVNSDSELFVALQGWDEVELDQTTAEVAELLDGSNDVQSLLEEIPASRFEVTKAIGELVHSGLARRCTGDEVEGLAQQALADGDDVGAVALLTQALQLERSNHHLRQKLAELYERLGRAEDAAAEYALLGYQLAQGDHPEDALDHYAHAVDLNPSDLGLHERRVELLLAVGDHDNAVQAMLAWVDLLLEMGVADRARGVLEQAVGRGPLRDHCELVTRLAEVESSLGRAEMSARYYRRLAEQFLGTEPERGLDYLRKAAAELPDDEALQARVHDIATGRAQRRRVRRRRLIAVGSLVTVITALGLGGAVELTASYGIIGSLRRGLGPIEEGAGLPAVAGLQEVVERFGWAPTGRSADEMAERLVELHFEAVEDLLAEREHERAAKLLDGLRNTLQRADRLARCEALNERLGAERTALELLERVEDRGADDREAVQALTAMTRGTLLDFYLAQLPRLRTSMARQAVLKALRTMDSPRSLAVVARTFVWAQDIGTQEGCQAILGSARNHRLKGRESEWEDVYSELERALRNPETRGRAKLALQLLRGQ